MVDYPDGRLLHKGRWSFYLVETNIGRAYNERLAKKIDGFVKGMKGDQESAVRTATGRMPRLTDFIPVHEQARLVAMSDYVESAFKHAETSNVSAS